MSIAVLALSEEGAALAAKLAAALEATVYVHEAVAPPCPAESFASVLDLTRSIFAQYAGLVYLMPCGVAVRAVAAHAADKHRDPAVVVVDIGARWAVSLLSGHEGGANELALTVGNILGAEPVISTTTEARKTLIAGIGCRRGVASRTVLAALEKALAEAGETTESLRLLATAGVKRDEPGLHEAAGMLKVPLRIVPDAEIRACAKAFAASEFVEEKVGLPAVAEPAALLAGRRTRLLLEKRAHAGVTVALAKEECGW